MHCDESQGRGKCTPAAHPSKLQLVPHWPHLTSAVARILTYDSEKWAVDSVEKAGSYNGLKRFNITAHRTTLYPGSTATARTTA